MQTAEEKIRAIEKEIRETPYHKATQHHIGRLRARIARLKNEETGRAKKGKGKGGGGFAQKKYGDATVIFIGPPSVGKSTLLNKLTNAQSKVAAYDFTTLEVIPGMMDYKGAKIQIFDIPGIIGGAAKGKGKGLEILSAARAADLLVLIVDIKTLDLISQICKELAEVGLRLDQNPPQVIINKRIKGGIKVISSSLNPGVVAEIAAEFRLGNAEIILKDDVNEKELIDALIGNCVYLPSLTIINKVDLEVGKKTAEGNGAALFISAEKEIGLEDVRERIWEKLSLMRIFLRIQGREADFENPLILRTGQTVQEAAQKIHGEMAKDVKAALVWGKSAKFPGQKVSLKHQLKEGDQVTFLNHQ